MYGDSERDEVFYRKKRKFVSERGRERKFLRKMSLTTILQEDVPVG